MEYVLLWLILAIVGLFIQWWIIKSAVLQGMKEYAYWKRKQVL